MALFGRKNDDDEEYEDSDELELDEEREESLEEKRLKRKLRDLKRENQKKRKEPPKPWGKKERIMILIILGVTVLVSAILLVGSRGVGSVRFSGFSLNFSMPNFSSLNIFKTETIEIRKKE